jgi:hypothetical protein
MLPSGLWGLGWGKNWPPGGVKVLTTGHRIWGEPIVAS